MVEIHSTPSPKKIPNPEDTKPKETKQRCPINCPKFKKKSVRKALPIAITTFVLLAGLITLLIIYENRSPEFSTVSFHVDKSDENNEAIETKENEEKDPKFIG